MCGILGIFNIKGQYHEIRAYGIELLNRIKHRGPDDQDIIIIKNSHNSYNIIAHQRLSIQDTSRQGRQPKYSNDKKFIYAINGEIFNYKEFIDNNYIRDGESDSESIGILYKKYGNDMIKINNLLEGMFGYIIYDIQKDKYYISRDHIGIIPLYIGQNKNGVKYISSELKVIYDQCETQILKPGHYIDNDWVQKQWYNPKWYDMNYIPNNKIEYDEIRKQLTNSVKQQLMGDVPFGLLISGGVDSSLIASIVCKLVKDGEIDIKKRGMDKIQSFCIGLKGSPDLEQSQKVADYLGTKHHQVIFTIEEGLDYIPQVVYHVETFNQTTIRASTPMLILSRYIKQLGIKVLLTGEGADEIFGGYLYFHKAPNEKEFHQETVRKCQQLHQYDLARANKSMMAWGIELRPPFLQKQFLDNMMNIDPRLKMPKYNDRQIEKYILRKAFDKQILQKYLPDDILWRQKEQFSDGVGYIWKQGIQDLCEKYVTDKMLLQSKSTYPISPPMNKEMYYLRMLFEDYFEGEYNIKTVPYQKSIACSTEKALEWDEKFKQNIDESGRSVIDIHDKS